MLTRGSCSSWRRHGRLSGGGVLQLEMAGGEGPALTLVTGRSPSARALASLGLRSGHASLAPHSSLPLLKLPFFCPRSNILISS